VYTQTINVCVRTYYMLRVLKTGSTKGEPKEKEESWRVELLMS
jgi:hypothetical protein